MVTVIYVPRRKKKTFLSLACSAILMALPWYGARALDVGVGGDVGVNADVGANAEAGPGGMTQGGAQADSGAQVNTDSETGVRGDTGPGNAIPERVDTESGNNLSAQTRIRSRLDSCDNTDSRKDNDC